MRESDKNENNVENLFNKIQKMYENLLYIHMLDEIRQNEFREKSWFGYDYIINSQASEELISRKFDLDRSNFIQKTANNIDDDNSIYEVIESEKVVTITINMPGTKKDQINLRINNETVEIMPDNPESKYHILIVLPCGVKPELAIFTYKNGILDIMVERENE